MTDAQNSSKGASMNKAELLAAAEALEQMAEECLTSTVLPQSIPTRLFDRAESFRAQAAAAAPAEPIASAHSVYFISAVSGLRYSNRMAAGDVSTIIVNGEPFKIVQELEDEEPPAPAPAGVPDVEDICESVGLIRTSEGWHSPSQDGVHHQHMEQIVCKALAALQSQVFDLKGSLDTSRLCTHERGRKVAQQAERITTLQTENECLAASCRAATANVNELTTKLAEAVELLCNAREELIEAIARLKGVGEVALAANDCSKDISAFLEKAREVMG